MSMADRRPRPVYRAQLATWLALAFFFLLSFPVLVDLPAGVSPGQILMLASFPVWFIASLRRGGAVFDDTGRFAAAAVLLCSGLLIFWAIVSAFHVDIPFRAARPSVSLLTAFALFFAMVGTVTRDRLLNYSTVLCVALTLTCIVTLLAFAVPPLQPIIFQEKDRAFGFFKNPNQYGIAISTVLPLAVAMLFAMRQRRLLWLVCVMFLGLGLIAAGSKANLLVSAITVPSCLILFSMIAYSGQQRVLMVLLTVGGCLVTGALFVIVLSIMNPRALSVLGTFVLEGEATSSVVTRSEIWAESIAIFRANPILGAGAGQPIHGVTHSHNVILDYARTLGVPGVVLVSAKLLTILAVSASSILLALRAGTARLEDRYLCIGLAFGPVAYIAANFSSDSLGPTTSPFLYSVLFLGLASRSLLTQSRTADVRAAPRGPAPGPATRQGPGIHHA